MALVGAGGAGKTTLAEALLYVAKETNRRGSVPEQNTVSDWDDEERERGHSIFATPLHLDWEGKRIHLIDTPGAIDFIGETILALAAVELAVVCVNAHDGIGVATRRAFRAVKEAGIPCAVLVTRIETENVDAEALHAAIRQTFGDRAVPLNLPDVWGAGVSQVVDVFGSDLPPAVAEAAAAYRQQVTDRVVEVDDQLLERYFETGKVSAKELEEAFPRALRAGNIVPVLHVSAEKEVGLKKLLTFLVHDGPAPHASVVRGATDAEGKPVSVDPVGALLRPGLEDPGGPPRGQARLPPGLEREPLQQDASSRWPGPGSPQRIGDLLQIQGEEMQPVAAAQAGDLVGGGQGGRHPHRGHRPRRDGVLDLRAPEAPRPQGHPGRPAQEPRRRDEARARAPEAGRGRPHLRRRARGVHRRDGGAGDEQPARGHRVEAPRPQEGGGPDPHPRASRTRRP